MSEIKTAAELIEHFMEGWPDDADTPAMRRDLIAIADAARAEAASSAVAVLRGLAESGAILMHQQAHDAPWKECETEPCPQRRRILASSDSGASEWLKEHDERIIAEHEAVIEAEAAKMEQPEIMAALRRVTTEQYVNDWLASPEAERRLAQAISHVNGKDAYLDYWRNDLGFARAILKALRTEAAAETRE